MSDIQTDEGFFSARDGLRLFWHTARAPAPVAHVAVVHGYAEHLGRHSEVTRALVDAGYTAHLVDCRGHGQSGGKRAHVAAFDDYLSDLELFLARIKEQAAGLPVFILGHSHGGLIAARYLLDKPEAVRGVVLSSPYFRLKLPLPKSQRYCQWHRRWPRGRPHATRRRADHAPACLRQRLRGASTGRQCCDQCCRVGANGQEAERHQSSESPAKDIRNEWHWGVFKQAFHR